MSLNADTLLDRNRLKQQLNKWRIITIVIALIAALGAFEKFSRYSPIRTDYIARITVDGIITDDLKMEKLIDKTAKDPHAKAVLVWLDTPGGSAVGGQELYLDLRKTSKKKPVVAVMRTMAASAGYMASLGADRIVAREGTITGSIGVIMEAFEATELAEKLGIHPIVIKSGPNKAAPNPLEKYTAAQNVVIEGVIKDFFNWFVGIVAERRHMPLETAEKLADGRIYTGRQALQANLIDELGGEDEAVQWLAKERKIDPHLEIRDVKLEEEDPSLFQQLTQLANGKIGAHLLQRLDGLNAIWQPNPL
ncbi:MAG TPA: signal peptide peptidase SppA [Rickettsiales bacterium]|nr:signal peptide peptidase SppA [Rickettsiales bacterium]